MVSWAHTQQINDTHDLNHKQFVLLYKFEYIWAYASNVITLSLEAELKYLSVALDIPMLHMFMLPII